MIVSFPMYALPQMQASMQSWWHSVADKLAIEGVTVPQTFSDPDADLLAHWRNPDLLLSQTCGFPLVSKLKQQVKLVGTLNYSTQYCEGPNYCSLILVHKADNRQSLAEFRGASFTYNGTDSQSGFNALRNLLVDNEFDIPFFAQNILSGQHIKSIIAVGEKKADMCSVDCVTYALVEKYRPELIENTRILTSTPLTPGLPLITSLNTPEELVDQLFAAIKATCNDEALSAINNDLLIKDISKIPYKNYQDKIRAPHQAVTTL